MNETTQESAKKESRKDLLIYYLKVFLIAAAIMFVIYTCMMISVVDGESMEDTLLDGNLLVINKLAYVFGEPRRGDIVVFESDYNTDAEKDDRKYLVKRVIGVTGDVIETDGKTLTINHAKATEPYVKEGMEGSAVMETWTVPEGCVFVMGDNRDNSADSRIQGVGFIALDDITGKAVLRFWPLNSVGRLE